MNTIRIMYVSTLLFLASAISVNAAAATNPKEESVAKKLSMEFRAIAKKSLPATVFIKTHIGGKKQGRAHEQEEQMDPYQEEFWRHFFGAPNMPQRPRGGPIAMAQGSGFFISADGYIVTNNHVIADASSITVTTYDQKEFPAKIIGQDPNTDIALLKIEGTQFPFFEFGNSDDLEVGDLVLAIGSPFGLQATVTQGIISSKCRTELDIANIGAYIQFDAAINRGNSGGALVNTDAQVVGMNTAIAGNTGGNHGVGFAITSNMIKYIVGELKTNGKIVRGYLGVALQRVEGDIAPAFGLTQPHGALVTDVVKDGPADRAGIKPGDIIVKVDDKVIDAVGSLRNYISMKHPNDSVLVVLLRDNKEIELKTIVGVFPNTENAEADAEDSFGFLVQDLTPEIARELGYTDDKGVLIKYVAPNSVAQFAGLKRGQLILSVNRRPVRTTEEFYAVIKDRAPNSQLLLHVKDGPVPRFVILRSE